VLKTNVFVQPQVIQTLTADHDEIHGLPFEAEREKAQLDYNTELKEARLEGRQEGRIEGERLA